MVPTCTARIAALLGVAFATAATGPSGMPSTSTLEAQSPADARTAADPRLLEAIEWYLGTTGRVDDDRARELLSAAAEDPDDTLAVMWLARVHSTGRMGFEADPPRARAIATGVIDGVQALAVDGDVEAQFLMGTAYDEGLGKEVDHAEALRWYRRAAFRGHVLAAHNVGNVYRDGRGVEADMSTAVMWWLRAARAGDVIPQLRLGEAFEAGNGVPRSIDTATEWYRRAAAAGNQAARQALARLTG